MKPNNINFFVLFLFVFFEVFLFEGNTSLQFVITTIEYLFVTFMLFRNLKLGISYFICFTLLAVGQETQMQSDAISFNFFSLRLSGFSLNILYSIFLLLFCLIREKGKIGIIKDSSFYFFIFFIIYSSLLGLIYVALGINYMDNYIKDAMTYAPFFIYIYLISLLTKEHLKKIINYGVALTCLMILMSILLNKYTGQEGGYGYYVLSNTFYYILPVLLIFLRKEFSKLPYLIYCSIFIFALIKGVYFISGKNIMIILFVLVWLLLNAKNKGLYLLVSITTLIFFVPIFKYFIEFYSGTYIAFKFSQILDLALTDEIMLLASKKSSMGNIIAESITLLGHFYDNIFMFFTGKGFGGGLPDVYGYLRVLAGKSGYAAHDLLRNDFHKLHLPVFEIFLKTGLLGLFFYMYIVFKNFLSDDKYSLFYLIMLLTTFYVSKEHFLLTLLFLYLSKKNKYSNFFKQTT